MDVIDTPHAVLPPCAGSGIRRAIRTADRHDTPFRYWLMQDVLPRVLCQ